MLLNNELIFNLHCIFLFYLHGMSPGLSIMQNNDKAVPEEDVWNNFDSNIWNNSHISLISFTEVGGNFSPSLNFSGADGPNGMTEMYQMLFVIITTVHHVLQWWWVQSEQKDDIRCYLLYENEMNTKWKVLTSGTAVFISWEQIKKAGCWDASCVSLELFSLVCKWPLCLHFELVPLLFSNGEINSGSIYNYYYVYHIS